MPTYLLFLCSQYLLVSFLFFLKYILCVVANFQFLFIWKYFYFPCYQKIVLMVATEIANCPLPLFIALLLFNGRIPWVLAKHMAIRLGTYFFASMQAYSQDKTLWLSSGQWERWYMQSLWALFIWKPNALLNHCCSSQQTRMRAYDTGFTLISNVNILGNCRAVGWKHLRLLTALHGKAGYQQRF